MPQQIARHKPCTSLRAPRFETCRQRTARRLQSLAPVHRGSPAHIQSYQRRRGSDGRPQRAAHAFARPLRRGQRLPGRSERPRREDRAAPLARCLPRDPLQQIQEHYLEVVILQHLPPQLVEQVTIELSLLLSQRQVMQLILAILLLVKIMPEVLHYQTLTEV